MGVKFGYYKSLGARQRRIYDQSDGVTTVRLPAAGDLQAITLRLRSALASDDRATTEAQSQALVAGILRRLHVDPVDVRVLAVRPSTSREELHGLYEYGGRRQTPLITVWMRTVQRRQVVAFKTFLRTLLHEVVHHLDYRMLKLADSYHTQGFYKRAESLYRQLAPAALPNESPPQGAEARALAVPLRGGDRVPRPRAAARSAAATPGQAPSAARSAPGMPRKAPAAARNASDTPRKTPGAARAAARKATQDSQLSLFDLD